jgi:hypothetical protein
MNLPSSSIIPISGIGVISEFMKAVARQKVQSVRYISLSRLTAALVEAVCKLVMVHVRANDCAEEEWKKLKE